MPEPRPSPRLPYRRGELDYRIIGAPWRPLSDLYFHLMRAPAWQLVALSLVAYLSAIAGFALLFRLGGDCIDGARPGSWRDAFWFSVHTFSTIGYGTMSPATPWANTLVTLESWLGLSGVAVGTALLFAKFARPTARIRFADALVICQRHGIPTLQVRFANERTAGLVDVSVEVYGMFREKTPEGQRLTRLRRIPLEREHLPYLGMTFTGIHPIREGSPLLPVAASLGPDADPSPDPEGVLLAVRVNLTGVDLSMLQTVWAMEVYPASAIRVGHRYVDAVERVDGRPTLDLRAISLTEPESKD